MTAAPGQPTVRFRVLGPLEVTVDGRDLPVRGVVQRSALGFLLLNADRVVTTDDMVRALWTGGPPRTARKMVQNAVSALRGTLARNGVGDEVAALLSHASGYRLLVTPSAVDLARFRHLTARGRADLAEGTWERAASTLREGLDLWRGRALADLAATGVAWPELEELKRERGAVVEDRFEADLACGRHHEVTAELEAAVDRRPDRERLSGQLMLALYRCGRQVEALAVYQRLRTRLGERFGLEPGRAPRLLEQAILTHDPLLDQPAALARIADGGLLVTARPDRRVIAVRPRQVRPPVAHGPGPELDVLRGLAALTRSRRCSHVVTVVGTPDDGTTRLVDELVASAHGDRAFRCLPVRLADGDPLAALVRSCCGIADPGTAAAARVRLGLVVRRLAGPGRAATLLPCLEDVLRGATATAPPDRRRARLVAVARLLEFAAARCPLVVVVEDVDRAAGTPRELVELIASGGPAVPLLVVATARPGPDRDTGGNRYRGVTVLTLGEPADGTPEDRC
ncbi:BTAD domain-containing putative transcriptional regulator [Umezawaea sp. NPDC059074]|uniref:BTAD domain-containing putative transcriptional regulator n=1 Tax=Umezawaea sp. NPDC059074 TaxID=3346716 RepID=UPI003678331A